MSGETMTAYRQALLDMCGDDWHQREVLEADFQRQDENGARLEEAIRNLVLAARPCWHLGDGYGGEVKMKIETAFSAAGLHPEPLPALPKYRKKKIPHHLARQVMERDEYRCCTCGTHLDLCCDHVVPESKGGPTTLDNLQTLCRPCNSRKAAR